MGRLPGAGREPLLTGRRIHVCQSITPELTPCRSFHPPVREFAMSAVLSTPGASDTVPGAPPLRHAPRRVIPSPAAPGSCAARVPSYRPTRRGPVTRERRLRSFRSEPVSHGPPRPMPWPISRIPSCDARPQRLRPSRSALVSVAVPAYRVTAVRPRSVEREGPPQQSPRANPRSALMSAARLPVAGLGALMLAPLAAMGAAMAPCGELLPGNVTGMPTGSGCFCRLPRRPGVRSERRASADVGRHWQTSADIGRRRQTSADGGWKGGWSVATALWTGLEGVGRRLG